MPVAIDTSVLISAEKQGDFDQLLPEDEGPFRTNCWCWMRISTGSRSAFNCFVRSRYHPVVSLRQAAMDL